MEEIIEENDQITQTMERVPAKLIAALAKAKKSFKPIIRSATHPYHKYDYAPLEVLIAATEGALSDNGLALLQIPDLMDDRVVLRSILGHESGEAIVSIYPVKTDVVGEKGFTSWQEIGKQLTYLRRYVMAGMLGIQAEHDDDASEHKEDTHKSNSDPLQSMKNKYFVEIKDLFKDDVERKQWQKDVMGKGSTEDWTKADITKALSEVKKLTHPETIDYMILALVRKGMNGVYLRFYLRCRFIIPELKGNGVKELLANALSGDEKRAELEKVVKQVIAWGNVIGIDAADLLIKRLRAAITKDAEMESAFFARMEASGAEIALPARLWYIEKEHFQKYPKILDELQSKNGGESERR